MKLITVVYAVMVVSDNTSETYTCPPIVEAIMDVTFESSVDAKDLEKLRNKYLNNYSKDEKLTNVNVKLNVSQAGGKHAADVDHEHVGQRFSSEDMTKLLIIKPSNFTISQLAPYPGWDDFYKRFVHDWKIWKRVVGYKKIARIGVRYINRIDIPVTNERVEHEDYLNIYPKLPSLFPFINSYKVECITKIEEIECQLRLNSTVVPAPILNYMSFIVDQDIFKNVELPQNDEGMFSLLNAIHVEKNKVFELCISDKARELFK